MQPHQERVVAEKKELDDKREKLGAFIEGKIYQSLIQEEQHRLSQQAIAMTTYSRILGERIAAFPPEPKHPHISEIRHSESETSYID